MDGPGVGGDEISGGGVGETDRVARMTGPRVRQKDEVLLFTAGAPLS